ncbi:MAG TPA: DUF928 domain-containing protein [Allocoleopsis sp.]
MKTFSPVTTSIAGTTSILSALLLASPMLPVDAASNSNPVLPNNHQTFIISQATRARIRFIPPPNSNPRRSQGAGSRGCDESLPDNLVTLLIPSKEYAGQTVSSHPSFFLQLSKSVSVPMVFTLTKAGVPQPLYRKQINSPQSGLIQIEMPKDRPELVPGQVYQWSVALVCYPKRPSSNPFFSSWIERVPVTPALQQQLSAVSTKRNSPGGNPSSIDTANMSKASPQENRDRAAIYAQAGLWYDAIDALVKARMANPNDPSIQADFRALMDQVGLTQVAKSER